MAWTSSTAVFPFLATITQILLKAAHRSLLPMTCLIKYAIIKSTDMKNGVFWVVTPCGSCKNRRFGGTWRLLLQGDKNR
jgi:hypothetical protein